MLTILISVLAVLVSMGSLAIAYTSNRRSHMPVLQFISGRRWWPQRFGLSRRRGGWADPVLSYRPQ
ncbi:hypothetical protein [Streptomyces sp. NPDC001816]|uniref:hypothetical protein n=1 Tax=Streptomyces sp. NPDC001816 TaxID=3364612 RepID=UPI0036A82D04